MSMNPNVPLFIVTDDSKFKKISSINGDGFELKLRKHYYYKGNTVQCYEFGIMTDGKDGGIFIARVTKKFSDVNEEGHAGIELTRDNYGEQLPSRITKAMIPLFKAHGLKSLMFTCDEDKNAIQEACKELGAEYMDTIAVGPVRPRKMRFKLAI
ncbi:MAG: hypothetical protein H0X33_08800 [Taibaiella sp.]|nr:hypothetical protein [Taibaiella sp.]